MHIYDLKSNLISLKMSIFWFCSVFIPVCIQEVLKCRFMHTGIKTEHRHFSDLRGIDLRPSISKFLGFLIYSSYIDSRSTHSLRWITSSSELSLESLNKRSTTIPTAAYIDIMILNDTVFKLTSIYSR
ncbi:unnamed protein product [Acanthoscelides obtectus]|uniref:Uncharacterized protein n=1 Tax=Acanthoscelides obtectus TaxID=200917 RepID=A0A9P0KKV9_ACAOB|nr:unnamed protein product [Acanthoscelides obtectus]CAK1682105.1 hypothetical protein AOBTE_LOCUS33428 [Acanthoscelides obtectus]